MAFSRTITGTDENDTIRGKFTNDTIFGLAGDDEIFGRAGRDRLFGEGGDDELVGNSGRDWLFGGAQDDYLRGGDGNDRLFGGTEDDRIRGQSGRDALHGDSGLSTEKGSDGGEDELDGGGGRDTLYQSDGNDTAKLGSGRDTMFFKWQDPTTESGAAAFTLLTDFDPEEDRMVFDVEGLGSDAEDANFVDGGDGTPNGRARSFFQGDAADSDGEAVMVLTDTGFATAEDAVEAAQNEASGDFVLYFNTTFDVGSLLFVDGADAAHSIARFSNIESLEDLEDANFGAADFLFG